MLRSACSLALLCFLSCFWADSLLAHEYKTGDYVVVLSNTHLEGAKPEDPHGEVVWLGRVLSIRKQDGNRLLLNGEKPGWVESHHVMPCDEVAIARLTEWIVAEPENARLYCGRGNVYGVQCNWKKAFVDFTDAIRLSPEPDYYAQRATAYFNADDIDKTFADVQEALRINPQHRKALLILSEYWRYRKDHKQAIAELNRLLQIDAQNYEALALRAENWRQLENIKEALVDVEHSLAIETFDARPHMLRAILLLDMQRFDDSIKSCGDAIQCNPDEECAFALRGRLFYHTHDYAKAAEDCSEAIRLSSQDPEVYYYRALTYLELKQIPQAFADFAEVLRVAPDSLLPYQPRAEAWAKLGKFDKAVEDLSKLIEKSPRDSMAHVYRGAYFVKLKMYDEALEDSNVAVELSPQSAEPYINRGVVQSYLNRNAEAEDDFSEAIFLRPNYVKAYRERARARFHLGRNDEAFEDLAKCLQIAPTDTATLKVRAIAYTQIEKVNEALIDIEKAVATSPDDVELLTLCVKMCQNIGKDDLALDYCKRLLAKEPTNSAGLLVRATCLHNQGKYKEAIADLDNISNGKLDEEAWHFAKQLKIHSLFCSEQFEQAISLSDALLKQNPRDSKTLFMRAESRNALGDQDRARADLAEATKLGLPPEVFKEAESLLKQLGEQMYPVTETPFGPTASRRTFGYPGIKALLTSQGSLQNTAEQESNDQARLEMNLQEHFREIQQRIQKEPMSGAPHLELASYWLKVQKPEEAFAEYSEALRLDPTCVKAYIMRAKLYADRGEYEKANADAERAFEFDPSQGLIRYAKPVSIYGEGSAE